jgi:hypothetical protein
MADLHTCLSTLGRALAAKSRELLAKQRDFSERWLCAAVCEARQRRPDRRLVAATVVVGLSQEWLNAKPAKKVACSRSKERRPPCSR